MPKDKGWQSSAEEDTQPWSPYRPGKPGCDGPYAVQGSRAESDQPWNKLQQEIKKKSPDASGSGCPDDPPKPVWPKVKCSTPSCETVNHALKKMMSKKVYTNVQNSISDLHDDWFWVRKCVKCVMAENGFSEVEVWPVI
jgi:hypothetical protein